MKKKAGRNTDNVAQMKWAGGRIWDKSEVFWG